MGEEVRKYRFFRMCLSLYYYQSKASRYINGLTYLKTRITTNLKHTIDSKNQKEENSSTVQKKTIKPQKEKEKERNKEEIQNQLGNKV